MAIEVRNSEVGKMSGWFYGRWRKIYLQMDKEAIARFSRQLAKKHSNENEKQLALRVVRSCAKMSATVGLATASPALLPGIGTAVAIASILPEEAYLMRKQCEMVLKIAAIYDFDLNDSERLYEIIALVGNPANTIDMLMTAKYDLRRIAAKTAAQLSGRFEAKTLLGAKAASRGVVRRLPALGFLVGGAINYYSFSSIGKKALFFYERLKKDSSESSKSGE